MQSGWVHELTDLTIVRGSLLHSLQAIEYKKSYYWSQRHTKTDTKDAATFTGLCSIGICSNDKIIYTCTPFKCKNSPYSNKKEEVTTWVTGPQTYLCVWLEDEFPLKPAEAQHTEGKHHWTQSRVSRYWDCLSAGLYFSLPHSCFRRLWPQFHRGHLLIKGMDWHSQVLSVCFIVTKEIQLGGIPTVCVAGIHQWI